jgi:H+/Cl- antiporter ClcA
MLSAVKHLWSAVPVAIIAGVPAGIGAWVFGALLHAVTAAHGAWPWLTVLLPLCGLLSAWLYGQWAGVAARGMDLVLERAHHPEPGIPLRMAPLIVIGTLLTHLGGGSAGREGTAVQMGAALAEGLGRRLGLRPGVLRSLLPQAGMSAGFGALFGIPWAAAIFAIEAPRPLRPRLLALPACLAAALLADQVARHLGLQHTVLASVGVNTAWSAVGPALALGLAAGLLARLFVTGLHRSEQWAALWTPRASLRPAVGGLLILAVLGAADAGGLDPRPWLGLGQGVMQQASLGQAAWLDVGGKLLLTWLTVGWGYKGGEVTPLFVLGALLGALTGPQLGLDAATAALLGLCAVFAGASRCPLACCMMAVEMGGIILLPAALVATALAQAGAWGSGIYKAQVRDLG